MAGLHIHDGKVVIKFDIDDEEKLAARLYSMYAKLDQSQTGIYYSFVTKFLRNELISSRLWHATNGIAKRNRIQLVPRGVRPIGEDHREPRSHDQIAEARLSAWKRIDFPPRLLDTILARADASKAAWLAERGFSVREPLPLSEEFNASVQEMRELLANRG